MKAFVCKEFGPIESHGIEEMPDPVAGDGQVVVDIKATGISFPDVLIVQGLYQFKPPFPFSPGSEISGIVSSVGSGVSQFKEGDRVMGNVGSGGFAEKGAFFVPQLFESPLFRVRALAVVQKRHLFQLNPPSRHFPLPYLPL